MLTGCQPEPLDEHVGETQELLPQKERCQLQRGASTVEEHTAALIAAPGQKVTTDDLKGPMEGFAETM